MNDLEKRMKNNYELRFKWQLPRRTNTLIRLDGKAFHTYTKGLERPFDEKLIHDMIETTKFLCENIQGCKLGYTQSDEITLVLQDFDNLNTDAWFDYSVQKMASISASYATAKFNELRPGKLAFFDSRVFQIPENEEVLNCLIWRQKDAERNSMQMLAQSLYSNKQLHKKNASQLQEMCFQKGHNWNDLSTEKKRGTLVIKQKKYVVFNDEKVLRSYWEAVETPIFTADRDYILNLLIPR